MNLERSLPCSGWSRWNLTPIPPCVDHIDSAILERETVLEWIWIDRKKICFGVIGLSQYMKAPPGLTSLIRALTVSCGVFMVTGQLTVLLGCWRFSLDIECLAAQTFIPDVSWITCCDRGYGRPSDHPRVFLRLRSGQAHLATYRSRYASGPTPCGCPVTRHLHGLATAIHETSGLDEQ
jgi:hypothetical protein